MATSDPVEFKNIIARHINKSRPLSNIGASVSDILNQTPGETGSLGAAAKFQVAPLTSVQLESVYGTPDEFMAAYNEWAAKYYGKIKDFSNLAKGTQIDPEFEEAIGNIDLKLLNRAAQDELYQEYLSKVLKLDELVNQVGLPAAVMPNANKFNPGLRYMLDVANLPDTHPAKIMLNALYLNFNDKRPGLDSLNIGRGRIPSPKNIEQTMKALSSGNYFSGLTDGDLIATLDIETTGPFKHSQARSMSIAAQTYSGGQLNDPAIIFSRIFDSPQMAETMVGQPGGRPFKTLSQIVEEMGGSGPGASLRGSAMPVNSMLDEVASMFEMLMEEESPGVYKYKRLVGHNVKFDLTKTVHTLQGIEGFSEHDRLKNVLRAFFERQASGDFVFDTLDVAREYLNNKAIEYASGSNMDEISKSYIDNLFSQEILAKVHIGGKATPFSMENIALNSNLFKLMVEEGQADQLYNLIVQGSHMDDTDVVLQDYVLKYIHSKELDIDFRNENVNVPASSTLSQEEADRLIRAARARVAQSSAIIPTTNIADVRHLSDMAFNYFTSNEGLSKVTLAINADVLDAIQAGIASGQIDDTDSRATHILQHLGRRIHSDVGSEGILKFDEAGAAEFVTKSTKPGATTITKLVSRKPTGRPIRPGTVASSVPEYEETVRNIFRFVLNQARTDAPIPEVTRSVGAGRPSVNVLALAINSLGQSYQTVSRAEQMTASHRATLRAGRTIASSADITDDDLLKALGSVYDAYGSGLSYRDRSALEDPFANMQDSPFQMGLRRYGSGTPEQVAELLAKIGDPFSFIDPTSRVASTVLAGITAPLGQVLNAAGVKPGFELADIAFSAHPKLMAELGIGYFKEQQTSSFMKIIESANREASKLVVPSKIVQKAFDEALLSLGKPADTLRNLGLSVNQYDEPNINLVWHIGEQLGDVEHRQILENIVRIYANAQEIEDLMGEVSQEIKESVMVDVNAVKARIQTTDGVGGITIDDVELKGLINELMKVSNRGGIVFGNLSSEMSEEVLSEFEKLGIELQNEAQNNLRTTVLRTASASGDVVVAPMVDKNAEAISRIMDPDLEDTIKNVTEVIDDTRGPVSRSVGSYNAIAEKLSSSDMLTTITSRVKRARSGAPISRTAEFYKTNKRNIGIGLAVTGLASFAYYRSKKRRQESIYNEVLEAQPFENAQRIDPLSDIAATYDYRPVVSDPFSTAGVVGNLDRNKIGHTRMGNNRNNHLFDLG